MGVQIDNLFPGLMTGRPGVNHPGVIKSRVSSPKANGKFRAADMGASGSLIEPPSQPVVKIVEAIYKANCNIKMNSIMIPPPLSYDSTCLSEHGLML